MNTMPTPTPAQPKQSSKKIGMIVGGALLLFALMVWGVASLVTGRDWALGLGSQQSTAKLTKVQRAIETAPDVLAVSVKNGNTSGTPFGHSIRVLVYFDEAKVSSADEDALRQFTNAVERTIYNAKVSDEYTVFYVPAKAGETIDLNSVAATSNSVATNKLKVR